jgi:hypothetical protein
LKTCSAGIPILFATSRRPDPQDQLRFREAREEFAPHQASGPRLFSLTCSFRRFTGIPADFLSNDTFCGFVQVGVQGLLQH